MPGTVRTWHGITQRGRCRECHKSIVWVTTDRGKNLPFDPGFTPRETVSDAAGRTWDVLSFEDFHKCPNRPRTRGGRSPRLF